jgi:hypothetical protein
MVLLEHCKGSPQIPGSIANRENGGVGGGVHLFALLFKYQGLLRLHVLEVFTPPSSDPNRIEAMVVMRISRVYKVIT